MDNRNERVQEHISNLIASVNGAKEEDFSDLSEFLLLKKTVTDLIFVKPAGFRGVVITAIAGKFINSDYDPINDFYGCSPRAIFEKAIYYSLQENGIPCGLSDPLNVAKNTSVLDEHWATGKRPESAAFAAIKFLEYIGSNTTDRDKAIRFFFFKLIEFANAIKAIKIDIPENAGISQQQTASKLVQFSTQCPESGTIPQMIASLLLNKLYENSTIEVMGGEESVFGTNTTSKKPGDIWLEKDSSPINIYEITVKKVDYKRLDDCVSSLSHHQMLGVPVTFICRVPQDINELEGIKNFSYERQGKAFGFVDITAFTHVVCSQLTEEQLQAILTRMGTFVSDINRPINTKKYWQQLFNAG